MIKSLRHCDHHQQLYRSQLSILQAFGSEISLLVLCDANLNLGTKSELLKHTFEDVGLRMSSPPTNFLTLQVKFKFCSLIVACVRIHTHTHTEFLSRASNTLFHLCLQGFDLNSSAWLHEVINDDDFTCHTRAVKYPECHILPLQTVDFILLYGLRQRMYEIIKPDAQKCCMWMMAVFSWSGPLWYTASPYRHINQRSFPRSHLEMNTVQSFLRTSILPLHEVSQPMNTKGKTHSTHSGCLSSNYHRRLSPEKTILHRHRNMMWFPLFFFFRECAWMFILCRLGAAGYSGLLNTQKRKGPKLRHDE